MAAAVTAPDAWRVHIEDVQLSREHITAFHGMFSDEVAATQCRRWRSQTVQESVAALQILRLRDTKNKPWTMSKAIVVTTEEASQQLAIGQPVAAADSGSAAGFCGRTVVGFINTAGPSPFGLILQCEVGREFRRRGLGSRALRMFLDEYWSNPRTGPRREILDTDERLYRPVKDGDSGNGRASEEKAILDPDELLPVTQLVAFLWDENESGRRLVKACGGKLLEYHSNMTEGAVYLFRRPY